MTTLSPGRLDDLLVERGLAASRDRAQALIAAGLVEVDGSRAGSADMAVTPATAVRLTGAGQPWVSRAGAKLDGALQQFDVDCADRVCLDAGASTGGFTEVLLSRGARLVYAVDVGRGQLHSRLTGDPRVTVLDRTNLRTLAGLPGLAPTLVTLDLSFISLRAVLPNVAALAPGAEVVALFKPQFEVPRGSVGHGGIVRDPTAASAALESFEAWVDGTLEALVVDRPVPAGIRGAKGNQEWLVHMRLPGAAA